MTWSTFAFFHEITSPSRRPCPHLSPAITCYCAVPVTSHHYSPVITSHLPPPVVAQYRSTLITCHPVVTCHLPLPVTTPCRLPVTTPSRVGYQSSVITCHRVIPFGDTLNIHHLASDSPRNSQPRSFYKCTCMRHLVTDKDLSQ